MARRRFFNRSKSTDTTPAPAAPARQRNPRQAKWYNRLALILLVLTPILFICYLLILIDQTFRLNPFPPSTPQA